MSVSLNQALSTRLLMGVARGRAQALPTDPMLGQFFDQLESAQQQHDDGPNAEQTLLNQLAVWHVYQRAGQTLPKRALSTHIAKETEPLLPKALTQRLSGLLNQEQLPMLKQWLQIAGAQQGFLQGADWPALLDLGRQHTALRLLIGQIAGQRACWLARQQADWYWLLGAALPLNTTLNDHDPVQGHTPQPMPEQAQYSAEVMDIWQTGNPASRELLFNRMRQADPALARQQLQTVWGSENAQIRQSLLTGMAIGLSIDDEEFLESSLDDRSRLVREQAAALLSQLPDSALSARMLDWATQLIEVKPSKQGEVLTVEMFSSLPASLEREGLNAKAKAERDLGVQAQWLRDIMALIPLDAWMSKIGRTPAELMPLIERSDWKDALFMGLVPAVLSQRHVGWARQLMQSWSLATVATGKLLTMLNTSQYAALFSLLPLAEQQDWLLEQSKTVINLDYRQAEVLATVLMHQQDIALDVLTTEQLLAALQRYLDHKSDNYHRPLDVVINGYRLLLAQCGAPAVLASLPSDADHRLLMMSQLRRQDWSAA